MATMMAAAMMMHLVFSQDTPDSCVLDGSCSDAAVVLQVSSLQNPPDCNWMLGAAGKSCDDTCPDTCDPAQQRALQGNALVVEMQNQGVTCDNAQGNPLTVPTSTHDTAPFIDGNDDCFSCKLPDSDSECNQETGTSRRLCCCIQQGAINNDPHIHTLRGAHYTLLKSGNFLAWSFSKASVDWRLLAAYSGAKSRFTTQSLLLLEKQSGLTLQMTAEDCGWQMKTEHGWRKVQPQLLSHGAAKLNIQEVHKHTQDPLMFESVMVLQMQQPGGSMNVARLLTHCGPKKWLNFKVKMYAKKDLDYVGGELGGAPRNQSHLSFLSAKLSLVMQKDAEFQVGTWASLGGSEAAEKFLKSKQLGTALLSAETCTEAAEQEAEKICAKHLPRDDHHAEVLIDCVYDVCHGGGEADALSAAAFISA
eukprot:s198_g3.t1